ncbi:MAG: PAS domain-containing protein [Deltaproteobacteria bacterium]|nr:PAS domain-containing protein [Deltaproteobacteria bacterium]
MALPKEELDDLAELKQRIEELRVLGISADKLEEMSRHIFQILNNARVRAEGIVQTVREPLIIVDKGLRIVTANPAFYKLFEMNPGDVEGRILYEINDRQWDIPSLRILLERIIPQNFQFNDYEVIHDFPRLGKRLLLLNARKIRQQGARPDLILLAMEDITERKKAEEDKTRLIDELQSALEKVKTLSGLLPVCAYCKRIRNDKGQWVRIEKYIEEHSEASFSHSICPDCERKLYGKNETEG